MLEIAVDTLQSAINAINGGADELELCSYLSGGGVTPSIGFVKEVIKRVDNQPADSRTKLNVTIRCRGGDDFLYSELDMMTMLRDIKIFKKLNVNGFVFGALTESGDIDEQKCMKVLALANPLLVTFSRAFDHVRDLQKSTHVLMRLGVHRVQSAGLCATVDKPGAMKNLNYLASRYLATELSVVPSAGVNLENAPSLIDMGCHMLHATCRKVKQRRGIERDFSMGISNINHVVDEDMVRKLKNCIDQAFLEKEMTDQ